MACGSKGLVNRILYCAVMSTAKSVITAGLGVAKGPWRWASICLVLLALAAAGLSIAVPQVAGLAGYALLIGIDTYEHPASDIEVPSGAPLTGRFEPALVYQSLKGPSHDVAAMRSLLLTS